MARRGCFVTATDTGVGKTVLASALIADLRRRGVSVAARKPVLTGIDDLEPGELPDNELLAAVSGDDPNDVTGTLFGPAVSPHFAAEVEGRPLDMPALVTGLRAAAATASVVIVEGVGGLLVPLAPGWDVRALAAAVGLPVLVAARPTLGTINHTLLTIGAAREAGLDVRAVVITPWPAQPGALERSNLRTIERLGGLPVEVLPALERLDPEALADAAAALSYDAWLEL